MAESSIDVFCDSPTLRSIKDHMQTAAEARAAHVCDLLNRAEEARQALIEAGDLMARGQDEANRAKAELDGLRDELLNLAGFEVGPF